MNVLYKGVDNPISISVPGVANENITASINGGALQRTGSGTYNVKMSNSAPPRTKVTVTAKMPNGESRNMGAIEFRVKRLPKPYAKIGDQGNAELRPQSRGLSGMGGSYGRRSEWDDYGTRGQTPKRGSHEKGAVGKLACPEVMLVLRSGG